MHLHILELGDGEVQVFNSGVVLVGGSGRGVARPGGGESGPALDGGRSFHNRLPLLVIGAGPFQLTETGRRLEALLARRGEPVRHSIFTS